MLCILSVDSRNVGILSVYTQPLGPWSLTELSLEEKWQEGEAPSSSSSSHMSPSSEWRQAGWVKGHV